MQKSPTSEFGVCRALDPCVLRGLKVHYGTATVRGNGLPKSIDDLVFDDTPTPERDASFREQILIGLGEHYGHLLLWPIVYWSSLDDLRCGSGVYSALSSLGCIVKPEIGVRFVGKYARDMFWGSMRLLRCNQLFPITEINTNSMFSVQRLQEILVKYMKIVYGVDITTSSGFRYCEPLDKAVPVEDGLQLVFPFALITPPHLYGNRRSFQFYIVAPFWINFVDDIIWSDKTPVCDTKWLREPNKRRWTFTKTGLSLSEHGSILVDQGSDYSYHSMIRELVREPPISYLNDEGNPSMFLQDVNIHDGAFNISVNTLERGITLSNSAKYYDRSANPVTLVDYTSDVE